LAGGTWRKAKEAKAFYAVLAVATLVGLALNFTKVDDIKAREFAHCIGLANSLPIIQNGLLHFPDQTGAYLRPCWRF
jgi:hypothetical protein